MFKKSLKYQFAAVVATLVIVLLGATAVFMIYQKSAEMTEDIFQDTYNFASFTSDDVMNSYQEDFVVARSPQKFEAELKAKLNLNPSISDVEILDYAGASLFTSSDRAENQLDRSVMIDDESLIERLKSRNPSVVSLDGRVVYLKAQDEGGYSYVDVNENPVTKLSANTRIANLVYPYSDNSHVLLFSVSYDYLDERIRSNMIGVGIFTLIGLVVALLAGFVLAGKVTAPLSNLARYVNTISHGDKRAKIKVVSQNEIGQLAHNFNQMIDDLEQYEDELVDQERIETELRLAADIQNDLIPKNIPSAPSLDVAATIHPAAEIGGDCYDFFKLKGDDLLFYIGDVTGHGVPAGLVVSIANALFYNFTMGTESTVELLANTNKILQPKTKPNMFLTALAAAWDEENKVLKYTSAGHEQPLLYSASEKKVKELECGGMALGMIPDISHILKEYEQKMEKGDVMVLFTDGIPEAWGPGKATKKDEHDFYGMERFEKSLEKHAKDNKSAKQIMEGIMTDLKEFMADIPAQDDITMIVLKRV